MQLETAKPSMDADLGKLLMALDAFREHRPDAPLQMLVVFLMIARGRGVRAGNLEKALGLSQSSISRNVNTLGAGREGGNGLGLVVQAADPRGRGYVLDLTVTGKALADKLASVVAGDTADRVQTAFHLPTKGKHNAAHWELWVV